MADDDALKSSGGQVLKQALANRQAKTTERGTIDPLTGHFTYSPDYLAQRDDTSEANIQNRIAQGRLNWDSQQQAERARADLLREGALNRAANRPPEAPEHVIDPKTGLPIIVRRSQSYGMQPAPSGGAGSPTEGERKSATLLQRLAFSQNQLKQAVADDSKAEKSTLKTRLAGAVPKVGDDLANYTMSPARQRVEGAQLDILDAALTLGTGAAYTREQLKGYARSYFPQPGDNDPAVIADKNARLANVIRAAETAAGRALPQAVANLSQNTPAAPPAFAGRNPMGAATRPVANGGWKIEREP
jgi:hypothetical protein